MNLKTVQVRGRKIYDSCDVKFLRTTAKKGPSCADVKALTLQILGAAGPFRPHVNVVVFQLGDEIV